MAVEALMQIAVPLDGESADLDIPVVLRQVHLPKALQLTDEEPVELYTELRPHPISSVNASDTWWEFQISSVSDATPCT
ncbi:hypothetical protein ASPCAL05532 [Aspergillus calidoustus]|uniref:Uncharacterized protein n=1 Tax=Aspergillus calidoustus TaxID=454130 RepID=A0A0U5FXL7_ASPCI|nr:hypothetical protein ASPCAL05532 [Aspergillus calidoustus]